MLKQPRPVIARLVGIVMVSSAMFGGTIDHAQAGANEGGALILHSSPGVAYSSSTTNYCGQSSLTDCALAITSVLGSDTHVFFALSAFPVGTVPSVLGVTFGIEYDTAVLSLASFGTCADFEINTAGWPASGSGTALSWSSGQSALLEEAYWFAAYNYYQTPTVFRLTTHPTQGASFADDSVPSVLDDVTGFGELGFNTPGSLPCPAPLNPPPALEDDGEQPESPPCVFPRELWVAPGNYLILNSVEGEATFSNQIVELDWIQGEAFRIEGVAFYPPTPREEPPMTEEVLREVYGGIDYVQEQLDAGKSIQTASSEYNARMKRLVKRVWLVFASTRTSGSEDDAVTFAVDTLRNDRIIDPSSIDVIVDDASVRIHYHVKGNDTRRRQIRMPRGEQSVVRSGYNASEACEFAEMAERLLSFEGETSTVLDLSFGNIKVRTGRAALEYLGEGGR